MPWRLPARTNTNLPLEPTLKHSQSLASPNSSPKSQTLPGRRFTARVCDQRLPPSSEQHPPVSGRLCLPVKVPECLPHRPEKRLSLTTSHQEAFTPRGSGLFLCWTALVVKKFFLRETQMSVNQTQTFETKPTLQSFSF